MRPLIGLAVLVGAVMPPGTQLLTPTKSVRAQASTDTRQAVRLEPGERTAVMAEMRTMLQSINRILHGLAAGDSAMVQAASRTAGMASALSRELQGKLPAHFVQLGSKTHRRFDELASASARTDKTVVGLAMITGYCVSCHDTYRLEETR